MAFGSELTDKQLKALELLVTGETVSETARLVGVNRKTITEWKKQEKFKVELDRQVAELKSGIEKKILTNLNPLLDKLMKIALKSDSDKTSLDAIIYAINRVAGTPTSKIADVSEEEKKADDFSLDDLDNVIELDIKAN
ncbi:phBC6A51 family helix-turn-helix protein [Clostridium sp. C8-1-8]|uniref:phBC6A51 family helix-turn-helix protein n=1 Tax=Clostridium sp. C8-1-8 TaxID=2698831 RepID=UPI00136A7E4E|nr:phBC6A51 family helix-turn-helix protein [Clostridium sp. C8-1-8]